MVTETSIHRHFGSFDDPRLERSDFVQLNAYNKLVIQLYNKP